MNFINVTLGPLMMYYSTEYKFQKYATILIVA